jgi:hypothetical protein
MGNADKKTQAVPGEETDAAELLRETCQKALQRSA